MDARKHLTDIAGPPEHEASTQIINLKSNAKLLFELVANAVLGTTKPSQIYLYVGDVYNLQSCSYNLYMLPSLKLTARP